MLSDPHMVHVNSYIHIIFLNLQNKPIHQSIVMILPKYEYIFHMSPKCKLIYEHMKTASLWSLREVHTYPKCRAVVTGKGASLPSTAIKDNR